MPRDASSALILIALCSLTACARPEPQPSAPIVVSVARCAHPVKPELPSLQGAFLESRRGYTLLKVRDARIRAYIAGLEDALECYEAQVVATKEATNCDSSDAQIPTPHEGTRP